MISDIYGPPNKSVMKFLDDFNDYCLAIMSLANPRDDV